MTIDKTWLPWQFSHHLAQTNLPGTCSMISLFVPCSFDRVDQSYEHSCLGKTPS